MLTIREGLTQCAALGPADWDRLKVKGVGGEPQAHKYTVCERADVPLLHALGRQ